MNVDTNGFTGNQRFSTNFPRPSRNGNQSKRIDKSTPLKAGEGRNLVLSCNSPHSCAAPSRAPHDHVTSSHNLGDGNRAAPHAKRPHRPRQRKTLEQVLAILQCTLRRFRRSKWFMILEVVVPILFAIALIFLDVKLGTGDIVKQSHLTLDDLVYFYYSQDSMICSKYSSGYPIHTLVDCDDIKNTKLDCSGDESSIPVKGLCISNINIKTEMLYYIASLKGKPRTPPSLDEVVLHQYLAKKSGMCLSTSYNKLMRKFAIALESETSTHIDSLCNSGYLYMAPLHNVPNDLINFISASSGVFKYIYGGTFDTVDEARRQLWKDNKEKPTWALIVINDLVNGFDIDIQLNAKSLPALNQVVTLNYRGGYSPEGSEMYMMSGYITIQKLLYDYFIYKQHARGLIPSDFSPSEIIPIMVSFPDIKNEQHFLVEFAGTLMSLAIILAFIYPFTQMTKRLVLDKELQTQQTMLVMGTMRHSMWISYFILSFLEYFLISILMTFVLCLHAFTLTNPLIIFMTLLVYSCTLIPLAGLISTLFSNCRVASLFAPMLYFILAVVNFLIHGLSETGLLALSFLSPTGMSNLLPSILKRESGSGFTMNDFTNPFFDAFPYKVILIIAMDFPIYLLFMLYLDAVLPYERSMPKHPLFFILPVVKRLKRRFGYCTDEKEESGDDDHDDDPRGTTLMDPSVGIDAMTGRPKKPIIRLRKVRKSYSRGKSRTVAVDSLSWVLYQGEVSVLLGPNGSGKSTTVGIITGMTKPDKGDCIVNGHSVTKETSGVRASIGLCPQLNTLWPDLTCREHLELFAKIKGLKGAAVENAIWDVLCAVDLSDKIDFHISMLSGGQKRKLCVAIAFVGQNRVIVLDEPTAGMDATARRHIWSLLRAMSAKRTILLITHYMDETDLLGDHVGILSNGKLTCAGSNLFLRSYSGFGYTLRLNLLPFDRPPIHKNDSLVTSAEREVNCLKETWSRLTNMIKNIMCDVYCTSQTDREITFRIPNGHENDIPKLLRYLERIEKKEIGLRSYALVAPSMEDVFMNMLEARSDNGHPSNVRTHLHQKDNEVVKGKPHAKPAKVQQGMSATPSVTSEKNPLSLNQDWCKGNVPIQEENVPRASKKGQSGTVPPTTLSSSGSEVSVQISKKNGEHVASALASIWDIPKTSSSLTLLYLQFKAVLYRRTLCFIRDYHMVMVQVFFPALCVLFVLLLGFIDIRHTRSLEFHPSMFHYPTEIQFANCFKNIFDLNADFFDALRGGSKDVLWVRTNFQNAKEMSSYLQDTWSVHPFTRYAAFHCQDPALALAIQTILPLNNPIHLLQYNSSSRHSLPFAQYIWQMVAYGVGLQKAGNLGNNGPHMPTFRTRVTAVVGDHPEPDLKGPVEAVLIGVILTIPFTFMPSNPVKWGVRERYIRARHLQKVSSMRSSAYWLGNFLFDFVVYVMSAGLIVGVFVVCGEKSMIEGNRLPALVVVLLLYGLCCCVGGYAIGFAFREPTSAQVTVIGIGFLAGFVGITTVSVLCLLPQTVDFADKMRWGLRLIPTYAVSEVIIHFKISAFLYDDDSFNPWDLKATGWVDVYMAAEVALAGLITLLWEHPRRRHLIETAHGLFRVCRRKTTTKHSKNRQQLVKPPENSQGGLSIEGNRIPKTSSMGRNKVAEKATRSHMGTQKMPELSYQRTNKEDSPDAMHPVNIRIADSSISEGSSEPIRTSALERSYQVKSFHRTQRIYSASNLDSEDLESEMEENSDVELERLEVYNEEEKHSNMDVVRLVDIRKRYASTGNVAVRNLSFSVMPSEVFCFLGTNGAGKSTTMSILTQELLPTSGRAYICGHDVVRDSARALSCIGYCTQFDTCFDTMTMDEYIRFYALVRGIPKSKHKDLVQILIEAFKLERFQNVQSRHLSGGNRRKLSLALALIGAPKVVLLDEPSAGVDPIARRSIWEALKCISKHCSIMLTTHYLEEVEALGECVAIMVNGHLRCIGDLPYLKRKYANDVYELTIRVDDLNRDEMTHLDGGNPIFDFMEKFFPCALLMENAEDRQYTYSIPSSPSIANKLGKLKEQLGQTSDLDTSINNAVANMMEDTGRGGGGGGSISNDFLPHSNSMRHPAQLSDLFEMLQKYKSALHISNFSVSHVSLEHVFMRVCRDAKNKKDTNGKKERQGKEETVGGDSTRTICSSLHSQSQNLRSNEYGESCIGNYSLYRRWRAGLHYRVTDKAVVDK